MAVTKEQIAEWERGADAGAPPISEGAAKRFSVIRAFSTVTAGDGMGLRLQSANGDVAEVYLNPVVAERLLRTIGAAGWSGDWLDTKLAINVKDEPPRQR